MPRDYFVWGCLGFAQQVLFRLPVLVQIGLLLVRQAFAAPAMLLAVAGQKGLAGALLRAAKGRRVLYFGWQAVG